MTSKQQTNKQIGDSDISHLTKINENMVSKIQMKKKLSKVKMNFVKFCIFGCNFLEKNNNNNCMNIFCLTFFFVNCKFSLFLLHTLWSYWWIGCTLLLIQKYFYHFTFEMVEKEKKPSSFSFLLINVCKLVYFLFLIFNNIFFHYLSSSSSSSS